MSNIRGIGSDRTTFNEKQEVGAFKIGILKKNQELRNTILKRNIGRYEKYDQYMNPAIGEVEDIYYNESKLPTIVGDLLQYTHGYDEAKTDLRKELDSRYGDIFKYYYYTKPTFNGDAMSWRGKYTNYVDHMAEVHGIGGYYDGKFTLGDAYNAIIDILKYSDASYMAKDMSVGVVRNINVPIAMSGVITTNVENMSGMDTELGIITNAMYSNTLYNASLVNDSRKRQYITPELDEYVGNTWKTIGSLSDLFPIMKYNGRTGDAFNGENFTKIDVDLKIKDSTAFNEIIAAENKNEPIFNVVNFQSGLRYKLLNKSKYNLYEKEYGNFNSGILDFKRLYGGTSIYNSSGNESISKRYQSTYNEPFWYEKVRDDTFHGFTNVVKQVFDDDLIGKTNKLFRDGSIRTLINRYRDSNNTDVNEIQTAVSNFGVSKGRNLLRKDAVIGSTENPYCRVWTMFHQYNKYEDAIRGKGEFTISKQQDALESYGQRVKKGWEANSVLNDNGTVQIAPHKGLGMTDVFTKSKSDTGTTLGFIPVDRMIHKYMFSIENLAWKDSDQFIDSLTPSQRGPNGGRIMWFPPYNLEFTENVTPEWEPHAFIGRGEEIYTYKNTKRSGTLRFTMLIDHPSMVDLWAHEGGEKDTDSDEMDLLRYFAGCGDLPINIKLDEEITECETIADNKPSTVQSTSEINPTEEEASVEETPIVPIKGSLEFYAFFPNNYSGKDYYKKSKSRNDIIVDYKTTTKGDNPYETDVEVIEPITYLLTANKTTLGGSGYEMSGSGLGDAGNYAIKYGDTVKWHYRVDCDVAHETLRYTNNYKDTANYQLNKNIENVKTYASGIMKNCESDADANKFVISLNDMNEVLNGNPSNETLSKIKELLLTPDTKILKMEVKGFASSHGYTENNQKLAQNRGRSVLNWLRHSDILGQIIPDNVIVEHDQVTVDATDKTNVSGPSAKAARSVMVYMEFETIPEKAENNKTEKENEFNASKKNSIDTNAPKVNINESESGVRKEYSFDEGDSVLVFEGEYDGKRTYSDKNMNIYYLDGRQGKGTFKLLGEAEFSEGTLNEAIKTGTTKPKCVTKTVKKAFKDTSLAQNEYKYFKNIADQKTPLFHKISERIKYFDPAFHSLTPEGFNARLNFLHQCTRQGPTCGASDTKGFSAGNLSFGRPPFCVLRVGDFYHTKILIDSISINYGERQWDLNPEGAGVQPMMADIDINFTFLGGSDLGGPINRLQNAISFNYYANTGVYDDRAMSWVEQEYEKHEVEFTDKDPKTGEVIGKHFEDRWRKK